MNAALAAATKALHLAKNGTLSQVERDHSCQRQAKAVLAAVAADPAVQDLVAKAIFRDDPSNELNADQARFLANAVLRVLGGES